MDDRLRLTDTDKAMLGGDFGLATAMAMRLLVGSCRVLEAESLLDIKSAHIDGCLYHGPASLDFVDRLVDGGGRVGVPTTLNVGSMDLIHPELFRGDAGLASAGRRLMEAHVALGCEATFTCAPYQLKNRPRFGDQIAWAESNAIVFANSVLGARTHRYGDFIDLCAALTGRAPACGLHLDENRKAELIVNVRNFPVTRDDRDIWYATLGLALGRIAGSADARCGAPSGVGTSHHRHRYRRPSCDPGCDRRCKGGRFADCRGGWHPPFFPGGVPGPGCAAPAGTRAVPCRLLCQHQPVHPVPDRGVRDRGAPSRPRSPDCHRYLHVHHTGDAQGIGPDDDELREVGNVRARQHRRQRCLRKPARVLRMPVAMADDIAWQTLSSLAGGTEASLSAESRVAKMSIKRSVNCPGTPR